MDLHIFTHMRLYSLDLRKKVIAKLAEGYLETFAKPLKIEKFQFFKF